MMATMRKTLADVGLLILRIGMGSGMLALHGWGKLFGFRRLAGEFADPIGLGSTVTLALAVFAEFFCALLVIFGLATRLACIPLIATMTVAFFIVHAQDTWLQSEKALVYLIAFLGLLLTGPGRYSLDHLLIQRVTKGRSKPKPPV